jgi:hypothetical protein
MNNSLENGRNWLIPRRRIFMIRCEPGIMNNSLENGRNWLIPRRRIFMIRCEPRIMNNLAAQIVISLSSASGPVFLGP